MKTFRKIYWLVIVIMIVFQLQLVNAQYAEDALRYSQFSSSVGARSEGMGNTVVGVADDFSALFGNPAGLSQQKDFEFSAGLSRLGYGNDLTFLGNKTSDNNNALNLNNLGLVFPVATSRGGLTFAFGFGRVANYTSVASFDGYNSSSSIIPSIVPNINTYSYSDADYNSFLNNSIPYQLWLANNFRDTVNGNENLVPQILRNVQQTGTIREGGGMNNWSFGGGMDIARNISLGVTLNFASGSYTYDRTYQESDPNNLNSLVVNKVDTHLNQFIWQSTIKDDITGFNALFGLMYRKPGLYRIGFTVKLPTIYEISETFTDDYSTTFKSDYVQYLMSTNGRTDYKVTTPTVLSGGISVQPLEWLLLAGDAEYTDWTQMEFNSDNPVLIQENRYIQSSMRETWNLRGGAEATILNWGLILRAGIESKPSPWKGDPSSYNQLIYTSGIGLLIDDNSTVNASFAFGSWNTFRDNYVWGITPASRTSESVTTQTINLTFSHRF
jgi:long-subunit fatty acid transport protein